MRYLWTSTGVAGAMGSPVQLHEQPMQAAVSYEHSTGCTGTITFLTAHESTGPWATLGSTTTNSSLVENFVYSLTGPFGAWIQPSMAAGPTTGVHRVRFTTEG